MWLGGPPLSPLGLSRAYAVGAITHTAKGIGFCKPLVGAESNRDAKPCFSPGRLCGNLRRSYSHPFD